MLQAQLSIKLSQQTLLTLCLACQIRSGYILLSALLIISMRLCRLIGHETKTDRPGLNMQDAAICCSPSCGHSWACVKGSTYVPLASASLHYLVDSSEAARAIASISTVRLGIRVLT